VIQRIKEWYMNANVSTTEPLTLVDPANASNPVANTFKSIPNINVFRALANAETLFPAYLQYVSLLFNPLELDSALERMIVLHVAAVSQCFYIWRQNVIVARSVGVSQEQIAALEIGDTGSSFFSEKEKIALRFAHEAVQLIEVTDATYADTKALFSDRAITEMLYVIGTYMFLARLLRTGRVPLDEKPADAPPPRTK
jgi:alkylhydroperoxidase family enzyme